MGVWCHKSCARLYTLHVDFQALPRDRQHLGRRSGFSNVSVRLLHHDANSTGQEIESKAGALARDSLCEAGLRFRMTRRTDPSDLLLRRQFACPDGVLAQLRNMCAR